MQIDGILFLYLLRGGWASPDPPHGGYMKLRQSTLFATDTGKMSFKK